MTKYSITNKTSAQFLGIYEGATPEAAIEAMRLDAGYESSAEVAQVLGKTAEALRADLIVTEVEEAEYLSPACIGRRFYCDVCACVCAPEDCDAYHTDDEVCGGSDGPGFLLHGSCARTVADKPARERRAIYEDGRELANARRFSVYTRAAEMAFGVNPCR